MTSFAKVISDTGEPRTREGIRLHGPEDFAHMRSAGRLAAETLDMIIPHVVPGVTTEALDRLCHTFIMDHGAVPAPLGYRGFPKSICTSVNHVVCHGIPGDKRLAEGDSLNIDVTVILDGWHGDTSRMFFVSDVSRRAQRLAEVTYEAMMRGIGAVRPGATVGDVERIAFRESFVGAVPAPLGYRGFPKSICTSVNHVVCHGIPGDKRLAEGDSLNIDVTVILDGWHGDTSRMFFVSDVSRRAQRLAEVTYEAMMRGIGAVRPGATVGDIGHAIQTYAESQRCSVVRDFCGHGLGRVFHDVPNILHFGEPGTGPELREGMFFTVEPMINLGRHEVKILKDGWTAVTKDRSLSAQFEHSIGVTADGCEFFTLSPVEQHHPPYS